MEAAGKTIHLSLSVRDAILWKDSQLKGLLRNATEGSSLSPKEARESLMDCLASGQEFLPMSPCDNFDPKRGCLGHAGA